MTAAERPPLREMALAFLKVGLTSFGGPLVAMGLIHREAVERKRWVTPEWFAETLGMVEAVPGPSATEMAIAVGLSKHGRLGGLVTGLTYVLPGFFIIVALSEMYFRYGKAPALLGFLEGLKPAAVAVLAAVCVRLTKGIVKDKLDAALYAAAVAASLLHYSAALTILALGLARLALDSRSAGAALGAAAPLAMLGVPEDSWGKVATLFLGMLKAGALVTGGGFVIASFISQDFVTRRGWITHEEFLAGLALAQFKPWPILMLSAFVGYKVAGLPGACAAALGAFLPCFGTLLAVGPHLEALRGGPRIKLFLRGMAAAAVGSILGVGIELLQAAVTNPTSAAVFLAALAALTKVEPFWVLAACGLAGLAAF